MPPKVMNGARCILGFFDPNKGQTTPVGIFNNVSYGLTYDVQPVFILGRYSAAEIEYTAQEPVTVTASGWRVIDHGAHQDGRLPSLQQLLTHEYLQLAILDRQTNKRVATIRDVRPTSFSTTISARALEELTITFMGIVMDDESTTNSETSTATQLP
jgi:hypothetical protein